MLCSIFTILLWLTGITLHVFANEDGDEGPSLLDILEVLECPRILSVSRPIPDMDTWQLLRQTYVEVVGPTRASMSLSSPSTLSGINSPFGILVTSNAGRGIVADEPIKKGTIVRKSKWTAQFDRAQDYIQFLEKLPPPLACDVMEWSYARFVTVQREEAVICVDLEPSSLINACEYVEDCNLGLVSGAYGDCQGLVFEATRDIAAGEELLVDYSEFSDLDEGWIAMGLLSEEDPPINMTYHGEGAGAGDAPIDMTYQGDGARAGDDDDDDDYIYETDGDMEDPDDDEVYASGNDKEPDL
jgi:hypothetical protein